MSGKTKNANYLKEWNGSCPSACRNLIFFVLFLSICFHVALVARQFPTLWGDEAYTLNAVKKSWPELFEMIRHDAHPPLYYVGLKLFTAPFHYSFKISKLFSIFPIFLMHAWTAFLFVRSSYAKERRNTAFICLWILATTVTPNFLTAAVELRMYSWAVFWVTMNGIYAFMIWRKRTKVRTIIFVLTGLGAALTHYYALLMEVAIYLSLYILLVIRERKAFLWCLMSGIPTVIGYAWWLPTAFGQFGGVSSGSFWITFSYKDIETYFTYLIGGNVPAETVFFVCTAGAAAYGLLAKAYKKEEHRELAVFGLLSFFLPFVIMLTGLVLTALTHPIFMDRYLFPALGLMWLGLLLMISVTVPYRRVMGLFAACIVAITAMTAYPDALVAELETGTRDAVEFMAANLPVDGTIYVSHPHLKWNVLQYFFPQGDFRSYQDLLETEGDEVRWFAADGGRLEEVEAMEEEGFTLEAAYQGDFDRLYPIVIYRVTGPERKT